MVKKNENVLDKLKLQLEYLNKRSKNFLWYIYKEDLWELDKRLSNCVCWCKVDTIKSSYFDEDHNDNLILEFLDGDNENIVLCPIDGGYM